MKNVKVADSYISNSEGTGRTGGVCGCNNGGTITNCYNIGEVSGTTAGGVCGGKQQRQDRELLLAEQHSR